MLLCVEDPGGRARAIVAGGGYQALPPLNSRGNVAAVDRPRRLHGGILCFVRKLMRLQAGFDGGEMGAALPRTLSGAL